MVRLSNTFTVEQVTDAHELARARVQRDQFDRNSRWLQANLSDLYRMHRGRFVCIAGEQSFVGDTLDQAIAAAKAAHPEDEGWFTRYIPLKKVARVYAR